jgi:hypothetical protein
MFNFPVIAAAALIPLAIGFLWYNPKFGFGKAWMTATGLSDDSMKGGNMAIIFGLTYLFSFFIAFSLQFLVIHQMHIFSTLAGEPGFDMGKGTGPAVADFQHMMSTYGDRFRTFKHGAFHGTMSGITLALPVLGVNALFERRGWKYILINGGYWIVCFALMGGVICQFA